LSKTLLIDCDFLFYKFAHRNEYNIDWDEGINSHFIEPEVAKCEADAFIYSLTAKLECVDYLLCISDDNRNFRYKVLPTYKHNRDDSKRPELWAIIKEHLKNTHPFLIMDTLEADDVLGILGSKDPDKYIVASLDKDLRTVPCTLFNWDKDTTPKLISLEDADRWFYTQVLMGDAVDGYKGIPGVGIKKAEKILDQAIVDGVSEWEAIVKAYSEKGLSEEDALQQARVARILRVEDYDFKKKEMILWKPKQG
jgi:DNA polymerase I